jgi:hypothetical protein
MENNENFEEISESRRRLRDAKKDDQTLAGMQLSGNSG